MDLHNFTRQVITNTYLEPLSNIALKFLTRYGYLGYVRLVTSIEEYAVVSINVAKAQIPIKSFIHKAEFVMIF